MLIRLIILLGLASALTGCASNSSQRVVATVLGRPIHAADVTPTEDELRSLLEPNLTPEQRLREERRARITSRIIRPLEARYVRERNLRPTEEEIDQFIEMGRRRNEQIDRKLRDDLRAQRERLDDPEATQEQRDQAAFRVDAIEALIALKNGDGAVEGRERPALAEYEALNQRELAGVWVATWKFQRSLFQQFGGPVVWRDTGPEPVGAYRKWLEGLERSGDFTIFDAGLRELFWSYWLRDADVVMDPDIDPFETPWWLRDDGDGSVEPDDAREPAQPAAAQSSR